MASRGTPLPWKLKEEIKRRESLGEYRVAIARELGISARTIRNILGRKFSEKHSLESH